MTSLLFFRCISPLACLLLLVPVAIYAQTPPPAPSVPDASTPADVFPPPRTVAEDPSSPAAPEAAPPPALSFDGPGDLMGGRMGMMGGLGAVGPMPALFSYRATWFPTEPVTGQATHLGYEQQDLSLAVPLWQDGCDRISASANVHAETFDTGAILPTTDERFPSELYDVRLGTAYQHMFDNGWVGGANVSVGSASDHPFDGIRDMTLGATASLRVPQDERNAWLFSLNYSTNSQVLYNIPIPGVAYFYNPTDWFQAMVGFPFANMTLRPTDDLSFQFSYALLTNIHAKALLSDRPGGAPLRRLRLVQRELPALGAAGRPGSLRLRVQAGRRRGAVDPVPSSRPGFFERLRLRPLLLRGDELQRSAAQPR